MFEKRYSLDEKLDRMAKLKNVFNKYKISLENPNLTNRQRNEIHFKMQELVNQTIAIVDAPEKD